jgi:hypothetical protein
MIRITWPDGQVEEHATARDFLEALRLSQWSEMSADDLRRALAQRARVWSETDLDSRLPAADLVSALADAELLRAEVV